MPQETADALARYEMATVIDDTVFAVEECAAELLHEQIRLAHEAWGLTMAPKKLHEFVFGTTVCCPLHLGSQASQVAALP